MTTQSTTLIFVLLTIMSAGHQSLKMNNKGQSLSTVVSSNTSNNILGSASQFAILSASAITNTGNTSVSGSVGIFPGTAITGWFNISNGSTHNSDSVAQNAQNDVTNAYHNLMSEYGSNDLTGQNLGGMTLAPGVYNYDTSCAIAAGTLTLQGDSNAKWIFKIGSSLTTAAGTGVNMSGGASASNVYWLVGSSATLGADTSMCGNIIAYASITMSEGARLNGRALARVGAVTLISNSISIN